MSLISSSSTGVNNVTSIIVANDGGGGYECTDYLTPGLIFIIFVIGVFIANVMQLMLNAYYPDRPRLTKFHKQTHVMALLSAFFLCISLGVRASSLCGWSNPLATMLLWPTVVLCMTVFLRILYTVTRSVYSSQGYKFPSAIRATLQGTIISTCIMYPGWWIYSLRVDNRKYMGVLWLYMGLAILVSVACMVQGVFRITRIIFNLQLNTPVPSNNHKININTEDKNNNNNNNNINNNTNKHNSNSNQTNNSKIQYIQVQTNTTNDTNMNKNSNLNNNTNHLTVQHALLAHHHHNNKATNDNVQATVGTQDAMDEVEMEMDLRKPSSAFEIANRYATYGEPVPNSTSASSHSPLKQKLNIERIKRDLTIVRIYFFTGAISSLLLVVVGLITLMAKDYYFQYRAPIPSQIYFIWIFADITVCLVVFATTYSVWMPSPATYVSRGSSNTNNLYKHNNPYGDDSLMSKPENLSQVQPTVSGEFKSPKSMTPAWAVNVSVDIHQNHTQAYTSDHNANNTVQRVQGPGKVEPPMELESMVQSAVAIPLDNPSYIHSQPNI